MTILRVLLAGEVRQKGDLWRVDAADTWEPICDGIGSIVEGHHRITYARPMEVPEVYFTELAFRKCLKERESIPMEPDMSKKCENLNTSVWRLLEQEEKINEGDEYLTLDYHWKPVVYSMGRCQRDGGYVVRRKITLPFDSAHGKPAPLTPIAFEKRYPYQSAWIFVWRKKDKKWNDTFWDSQHSRHSDDMTHWLPIDALPVPSVDKSLADELEDWAANINTGNCSHATTEIRCDLLKRAAKELRK